MPISVDQEVPIKTMTPIKIMIMGGGGSGYVCDAGDDVRLTFSEMNSLPPRMLLLYILQKTRRSSLRMSSMSRPKGLLSEDQRVLSQKTLSSFRSFLSEDKKVFSQKTGRSSLR